ARDERRLAADDHVRNLRHGEAPRNLRKLGGAFRSLDEGDIRAGLGIALGARYRGIKSLDGARVGPGDDEAIARSPGIHRRSHLAGHLLGADQLLSGEMAAALRERLVL